MHEFCSGRAAILISGQSVLTLLRECGRIWYAIQANVNLPATKYCLTPLTLNFLYFHGGGGGGGINPSIHTLWVVLATLNWGADQYPRKGMWLSFRWYQSKNSFPSLLMWSNLITIDFFAVNIIVLVRWRIFNCRSFWGFSFFLKSITQPLDQKVNVTLLKLKIDLRIFLSWPKIYWFKVHRLQERW